METKDIEKELMEEVRSDFSQNENDDDSQKMFEDICKIDGVIEYFEKTMARDMRRYFNQPDDASRWMVKGHYYFAKYLRNKILKTKEALYKDK